jgi:hypothetical protein
MFKIDYFIFQYFLTSKIAVLYKKNANGSPLLNRILFFPKNKLFSVMSHMALIYMTLYQFSNDTTTSRNRPIPVHLNDMATTNDTFSS